jgi:HTH-type transcriptional regulator/antitoxin HipB
MVAAVRSARDVGATVRAARETQGLTQANLAAMANVSRRWLIAIEQGEHHRAELDRVLRVLAALNLEVGITASGRDRSTPAPQAATGAVDRNSADSDPAGTDAVETEVSNPDTVAGDAFDLDAHLAGFRERT